MESLTRAAVVAMILIALGCSSTPDDPTETADTGNAPIGADPDAAQPDVSEPDDTPAPSDTDGAADIEPGDGTGSDTEDAADGTPDEGPADIEGPQDVPPPVICGCSEPACPGPTIPLDETVACTHDNNHGSCSGIRTCTEEGFLSPCDAAIPAEDICDGEDNDCDGTPDTVPCADQSDCLIEACQAGECVGTITPGSPCSDGDSCTSDGLCEADGSCSGVPLDCDDGSICTADTCLQGFGCLNIDSGLCSCETDADCPPPVDRCLGDVFCVITDDKPWSHCVQDLSTEVICILSETADAACAASDCDPGTGECLEAPTNEGLSCDGTNLCIVGNICTLGVCDGGLAVECADEDACNGTELCDPTTGGCLAGTPPECGGDICIEGAECDSEFGCLAGSPILCTDGKTCTADSCLSGVGCVFAPLEDDCCDNGVSGDGYCLDPLVANAGPDVLVDPGQEVVLPGSAVGGDGNYQYQWSSSAGLLGTQGTQTVAPLTSRTYTLTVLDGVGNSAVDHVTVQVKGVPLSLCEWPVIHFESNGQTQPPAQWSFDAPCTQATQNVNAKPSVLLSDLDFEHGSLTGQFRVETTDDDDLIGFVFGYQSESEFFLVDWKQGQQTFCTATVYSGLSLKKIQSPGALACTDFFTSLGTDAVQTLVVATPPAWSEFITYRWTLELEDNIATIWIHEGETLIHEISSELPGFAGGKFGFYNNSQNAVVYEFFEFIDQEP